MAIPPPSAPTVTPDAHRHNGSSSRRPRRYVVVLALSVAAALLLVACGGAADPDADDDPAEVEDPDAEVEEDGTGDDDPDAAGDGSDPDTDDATEEGDEEDAAPAGPPVDPAEVGANELGVVPVLMYHQLREDGGSVYDMTAEEFRSELTWLFDNGYRPITTAQLARGEIDVPAGTKPVVLTFDDSTASQAQLTPDGELDPETSLGILVEVASLYDDVEPRASVYVISGSLFGGTAAGEQVLEVLHGHGMELGNHTHTHPNLSSLNDAGVQEELATNVAVVTDLVSDAEVVTLSLPLGVAPANRELAQRGSAPVGSYEHVGVLLVGANPSPSPFSASFDAMAIPRIRSNVDPDAELESTWWLEVIESGGTNAPFVSDGDPDTISFPAELADRLDPAFADRANPY